MHWTTIEFTTSDYVIYKNHDFKEELKYRSLIIYMSRFDKSNIPYKYIEVDCDTKLADKIIF